MLGRIFDRYNYKILLLLEWSCEKLKELSFRAIQKLASIFFRIFEYNV